MEEGWRERGKEGSKVKRSERKGWRMERGWMERGDCKSERVFTFTAEGQGRVVVE
jgi:hypothetical protein